MVCFQQYSLPLARPHDFFWNFMIFRLNFYEKNIFNAPQVSATRAMVLAILKFQAHFHLTLGERMRRLFSWQSYNSIMLIDMRAAIETSVRQRDGNERVVDTDAFSAGRVSNLQKIVCNTLCVFCFT